LTAAPEINLVQRAYAHLSAEESLNVFGGTLGALRSWMLLFVELCIVTFRRATH
jgi:hypothetical protein